MNTAFPRILTLLRKERGVSQKQVSADLQVSQALLSHYEKGIRECGWISWYGRRLLTASLRLSAGAYGGQNRRGHRRG